MVMMIRATKGKLQQMGPEWYFSFLPLFCSFARFMIRAPSALSYLHI